MQPSNNSQQSSNLVQSSSNNPQVVPDSDRQIQSHPNPIETSTVSLKAVGSGFSLHLSKWFVLGCVAVAMVATFFLLTRGSQFCLFSSCQAATGFTSSLPMNFWTFSGGTAALVVLTTVFGIPLVPAVAVSFGVWFLMQMTLH